MKTIIYKLIILCVSLMSFSLDAKELKFLIDKSLSYAETNGDIIKPIIVTVDLNKATLRIVSVPFEAKTPIGSSEISLRSFAKSLLTQKEYQNKEWLLINGGFSSYKVDIPVGLLVVDGKVYSKISTTKKATFNKVENSKFQPYRWSGILCQYAKNKKWDIISIGDYEPQLCQQALQAGPVLVEPDSIVGIFSEEENNQDAYNRSIVCLMDKNRLRFILVPQETHLFSLSKWLSRAETEGGLGCRIALNLSGDDSSGIAIKLSNKKPLTYFGEGSFPLPSALIIE